MAQSIDKLNLKVNTNIIENIVYSGVYLRYQNILNKGCEINVQQCIMNNLYLAKRFY